MTFDELRDAFKEQARGLIDGGCDLLLLETIVDTLNAKAAIVAIEELYAERQTPIDERLPLMISVDDHRPQRPDAVGADDRRVLGVDRARQAVQRRHQLRARRARHAAVPRGTGARSPTATSAAIRTPACRTPSAPTTSSRSRPAATCASSPPAASSTSSAAAAARRRITSRRSRKASSACRRGELRIWNSGTDEFVHPVRRPRDADHPSRLELPDDRRAHQRHRLAEVRAADQGRRLRDGDRGGARAGARRRQPHRRQHGRGHARLRAGDDALPELHRDRAGHRARAVHDRQLEVVGHPRRA